VETYTPMSTGGVTVTPDLTPDDATRLALKRSGLLRLNPTTRMVEVAQPGSALARSFAASAQTYTSYTLRYQFSSQIIEPVGYVSPNDRDDTSPTRQPYADKNFWNLCGPGAGTVAAYYAGAGNSDNDYPLKMTGTFQERWGPHQEPTYWNASDLDYRYGYQTYGRAFILYMADAVRPLNPTSANFTRTFYTLVNGVRTKVTQNMGGIMDYTAYPATTMTIGALKDAMNWEMSDHNGGGPWPGYFWDHVTSFNQTLLHNDVVNDIVNNGVPVIVTLDAQALIYNSSTGQGNWAAPGQVIGHAITIIGYDDVAGIYQYVDTCGAQCSGRVNGGVHTLSQTAMYNAVHSYGGGYLV